MSPLLPAASLLIVGWLAAPLPAQSAPGAADTLVVPRLTGPITLDGRVEEPAWEAVEPLPATGHLPNLGAEPSERTEFRIAYDDQFIYFSCRNWDSNPDGIQGPTLLRDAANFTNDWCVLQLDTFNDEETALGFGTTPAGIRTDVIWPSDGNAGGNFTWNTFWDAAVHQDERGWYAEGRIPLSSLRFQDDGDDLVVMGMSMWRLIARKNELITYPRIDNRWGGGSITKASQFGDAAFRGIEPRRPVYVTPYAMGAAGRAWELNSAATGYDPDDRRDFDIGGDLKYALASNLTLDLTLNTDFAQAEADDQQVNLTRFSLFFPEKRLFFQERGATFAFPVGGNERLFHSRRVGLVGGEPVPILAGARVVGRVGEWDIGILDMQTGETPFSPSENLGVARFRRRVLNPNSYVGGIVTTRFAEAGRGHNVLYGLDGIFRVFGQDYLTLNFAQSFDAEDQAPLDPRAQPLPEIAPHQRALARAHWERRSTDGLTYALELARAGDTFDPGLGFILRRDYTKAAGDIGFGWRPGENSPLMEYGVETRGAVFTRNDDRSVETAEIAASGRVELKRGDVFTAALVGTFDDLRTGFDLSDDAGVPAGDYRFVGADLGYTGPEGHLLRANGSLLAGQFYDGRILSGSVSPIWLASNHLELRGTYQLSRITFPDRDQAFTAHIARLKAQVMVSAQLSGTAFLQYNSAIDRTSGNVRLRYNPSEGHDLYIVWNERLLLDRSLYDPTPPLSENRTLIIKYSRTFTFGG